MPGPLRWQINCDYIEIIKFGSKLPDLPGLTQQKAMASMTSFFITIISWNICSGPNLGHVLAGGNGDVGDINGKPELQQAYDLGKSI